MYDVLPLRAIIFQLLFLLIAIAIEAIVLHRILNLDYKTSVRYSATINLLSTILGWIIFFNAQPYLPDPLRVQLISYIFFEQFFPNILATSIPPTLVLISLGIFLGTFLVKLKGLDYLEILLGENKDDKKDEQSNRDHNRYKSLISFDSSRAYGVLVANACSFSAILLLLFIRLIEQTRYASL